jgi:membrane protein
VQESNTNRTEKRRKNIFKGFFKEIGQVFKERTAALQRSYKSFMQFITVDIWNLNIKNVGGAKKRLYRHLKVVLVTVQNLGKVRLGLYSVSLSFFSVMALVPFVAVAFFVTGGFGMEKHLEYVIYQTFAGDTKLVDMLINFANNIIKSGQNGIFGAISFLFFVWTIIWLIFNIQRDFNEIWEVKKPRSFARNLLYYIGFLIISPFLIILFLSVMVFFNNALGNYGVKIWHFKTISAFVQWIAYYVATVLALTVVNKYIPNIKVSFKAAINSSIITAFAFVIVQFLYTGTQLMVTRLNAVYGAFAAFPLFLVWLNVSWTIVLIGAEIAHAFENVDLGDEQDVADAVAAIENKNK